MTHKVPATFDGSVFRPRTPVDLEPGTEVLLTVDREEAATASEEQPPKTRSFIDTALSLSGEGPPSDWSQRVDHYLYGGMVSDDEE
jgi:predicted DNA-binding antitoxin AbrB/MazE fold protein